MKAKLRAGQKTAGGHSPRTCTPRGETPQGGKQHTTRGEQHTGKPTRQHASCGVSREPCSGRGSTCYRASTLLLRQPVQYLLPLAC